MKKQQKYRIILSVVISIVLIGATAMSLKKGIHKNSVQKGNSVSQNESTDINKDSTSETVSLEEKEENAEQSISTGDAVDKEQDTKQNTQAEDITADTVSEESYNQEYLAQTDRARVEGNHTYKIYQDTCSVSYDGGNKWTKVPVDHSELCSNEGGYAYENQLQDGSYVITEEKTAIVYGGTRKTPLSIIYSNDEGKTWTKAKVDEGHELQSVRVKQISFVDEDCGYLIVTDEKTMSAEAKFIYKTKDGGKKWSLVKTKTSLTDHLLYRAGFINEKLGFVIMVCHDSPQYYRTKDGGIKWECIQIPQASEEFIQPEMPYVSGGKLYMQIGMDKEGDNRDEKFARYESNDDGKSFTYTDTLVENFSTKNEE